MPVWPIVGIMSCLKRRISRDTKSTDGISVTVGEKVEVAGLLTKAETGAPVYAYYVSIQNGDNQGTALGQLVSYYFMKEESDSALVL